MVRVLCFVFEVRFRVILHGLGYCLVFDLGVFIGLGLLSRIRVMV